MHAIKILIFHTWQILRHNFDIFQVAPICTNLYQFIWVYCIYKYKAQLFLKYCRSHTEEIECLRGIFLRGMTECYQNKPIFYTKKTMCSSYKISASVRWLQIFHRSNFITPTFFWCQFHLTSIPQSCPYKHPPPPLPIKSIRNWPPPPPGVFWYWETSLHPRQHCCYQVFWRYS